MAVSREKWEEEIEEIKWLVGHDGLKTTEFYNVNTFLVEHHKPISTEFSRRVLC